MRTSDEIKDGPFAKSHDTQIGQSAHDKIMIWLFDALDTRKDLVELITGVPANKIVSLRKTIESPVELFQYNGPKIIGFVDLHLGAAYKYFYTEEDFAAYSKERSEILRKEKFRLDYGYGNVEIKTSVNVGETIRQIKYYSQGGCKPRWTVCAPAFPQSRILVEQGIHFIEYAPNADDEESFL